MRTTADLAFGFACVIAGCLPHRFEGGQAADVSTTTGDAASSSDTTSGSTTANSTSSGDIEVPTAFLQPSDFYSFQTCSVLAQDCPPGEKCAPWMADDDTLIDDERCVPVAPDADRVGEPCTFEDGVLSGVDSCELGAICWDLDVEAGTGTCYALCIGAEESLHCDHPDQLCMASDGDAALRICVPTCHPLANDCGAGMGCYPAYDSFVCAPASVLPGGGGYGDECLELNSCDAGYFCAPSHGVEGCPSSGCCSPFCEIGNPSCPGASQECVPAFEPGQARYGYEDVGFCVVPA